MAAINNSTTSKPTALVMLVTLFFMISKTVVYATDITVSGNGSESINTAVVAQTDTTEVSQSNDAAVSTTVSQNANTGSNSLSGENGSVSSIQTGNIATTSQIDTSVNQNTAQTECCTSPSQSSTEISGNGSESNNTSQVSETNNIQLTQQNNATIKNTVSGTANTGGNTSKNNSGSVTITTGDITTSVSVSNISNSSVAHMPSQVYDFLSSITSNGSDSLNTSQFKYVKNRVLIQNNTANYGNTISVDANTGGNSAAETNGIIEILTGDIWMNVTITNEANTNTLDVICKDVPDDPPVTPTPTENQTSGVGGTSAGQITESAASTEYHGNGGPSIYGLSDTSGTHIPLMPFFYTFLLVGAGLLISGIKPYSLRVTITLNY